MKKHLEKLNTQLGKIEALLEEDGFSEGELCLALVALEVQTIQMLKAVSEGMLEKARPEEKE